MYFNDFKNKEDIVKKFKDQEDPTSNNDVELSLKDAVVLFASYTYMDYTGDALVVYEVADKLYEVNGSHCSCNGLEGQWSPEETTWESFVYRYGTIESLGNFVENHGEEAAVALINLALNYHVEKYLLN